MRKYFCDLCGNELEQVMLAEIRIASPGPVSNVKYFEVCEKCVKKLESIIERLKFELNKETT